MSLSREDWVGFPVYAGASILSGILGSIMMEGDPNWRQWYDGLNKSSFTPPRILFPIVWTMLYPMIGIAAFLFLQTSGTENFQIYNAGLCLWWIQLIVNAVWTPIFFRYRSPKLALVAIILLIMLVLPTTILFYLTRIVSGILMTPYCVWILFACYLNITIVLTNRVDALLRPRPASA